MWARKALEQAMRLDPYFPDILDDAARVAEQEGDEARAAELREKSRNLLSGGLHGA